jgi:erythromycin esterase-like protein
MLYLRSLLLLALFGLLTLHGFAQSRTKKYVQEHLVPITSIQPDYADATDLAAIGQAIGEARVVMLGEQDHGDGATFLAKTRLIKYLHEQKGFNVLAFEGDLFALNRGWEQVAATPDQQAAFLHTTIHPYWSGCQQCDNLLYQYVPQTARSPHPLRITGFDNQLYSPYSRQFFPVYLHAYLTKHQLPFLRSRTYQQFFRPFIDTLLVSSNFITGKLDVDNPVKNLAIKDKQGKLRRFESCLDTLLTQLPASAGGEAFDRLLLSNLYALAQESGFYTEDHNATYNVRDAQMAANLDWLVNTKFAGEKILVWAASAHIAKGKGSDYLVQSRLSAEQQAQFRTALNAVHPMGRIFTENVHNRQQTYILGFISSSGTSQRTVVGTATALVPPAKNSLESWLPTNLEYAFLDFQPLRGQQLGQAPEYFAMQGLRHQAMYADWPAFFDGLFYLRTMTPCTRTSFQPSR